METRKKLPTSVQTFEEIRKRDYVYVDKTEYLVRLIDRGKNYFLARPRRFGKTIFTTTIKSLFEGKKELFKGLYAEEFLNREDFEPSPVIHLDISEVTTSLGIEGIQESLIAITKQEAKKLEIELSDTKLYGNLLGELISKAKDKYKSNVVILIDEYDKPYTDFVNNPDMADKVRNVLRDYYIRIKSNDEQIRFSFITGISKFTKFGVFSVLNTPVDISMMTEYAEICGYTEAEIRKYFPDYLEETATKMQVSTEELIAKMRDYYDGFSFDFDVSSRLYSPYSTLCFFENKKFVNFWMITAKPKIIADYMKDKHLTVEQFRNYPSSLDFVYSPGDMDTTPPEGYFLQSGFLTLKENVNSFCLLDYPNIEVLNSMSALLTENILKEDTNNFRSELFNALKFKDIKSLQNIFNRFLASIPYDDFAKAANQNVSIDGFRLPAQEWLYRSCLFSFLQGCYVVVSAEVHNNHGRADLVIKYQDFVWIIELKVAYKPEDIQKKLDEAKTQFIEKQYTKPYPNSVCIAMVIDDEKRQIEKCEQI